MGWLLLSVHRPANPALEKLRPVERAVKGDGFLAVGPEEGARFRVAVYNGKGHGAENAVHGETHRGGGVYGLLQQLVGARGPHIDGEVEDLAGEVRVRDAAVAEPVPPLGAVNLYGFVPSEEPDVLGIDDPVPVHVAEELPVVRIDPAKAGERAERDPEVRGPARIGRVIHVAAFVSKDDGDGNFEWARHGCGSR